MRNLRGDLPVPIIAEFSPDLWTVERHVTTNDRGVFTIEISMRGHFALRAVKGNNLASLPLTRVTAGEVVDLVALHCQDIEVDVVAPGEGTTPVVGADVALSVRGLHRVQPLLLTDTYVRLPRAKTDRAGRARFAVPRGAEVAIMAWSGSRLGFVEHPDEARVQIRLQEAQLIQGVVRDDETGKPIAGATVAEHGTPRRHTVSTDTKGRFSLSGQRMPLVVWAPGYCPIVEVPRNPSAFDVRLRRDGVVTAQLLGPDGVPLARAPIVVRVSTGLSVIPTIRLLTDANGLFSVGGAGAGEGLRAWVQVGGSWIRFCSVHSDEDVDLGDVRIHVDRRVAGRVTDVDHAPAGGVAVFGRVQADRDRDFFVPTRVAFTDSAGRFQFDGLPDEPFEISCYSPRSLLASAVAHPTRAGADPVELQLVEAKQITGRVVTWRGEPAFGVAVHAVPMDPERLFVELPASTTTDRNGRFSLPCTRGEVRYRVTAINPRNLTSIAEIHDVGGDTHNVELQLH